jgi:hypothetical protein
MLVVIVDLIGNLHDTWRYSAGHRPHGCMPHLLLDYFVGSNLNVLVNSAFFGVIVIGKHGSDVMEHKCDQQSNTTPG